VLHNPPIAHDWSEDIDYGPMDKDADGNRANTAVCLQEMWKMLEIDVNDTHILFTELNPVCSKTGEIHSEEPFWDRLCAQTMLCALSIGTGCIVAFGHANGIHWRNAAGLPGVTEFADIEGGVQFRFQGRVVRVYLGHHP
jgi:hypothetical protein